MLTQENTDNKPIEIYKNNKSYQEIVRRKYNINDIGLLYDDQILLLIYAYEWFTIPSKKTFEKVCYHPYLIKKDYKKLNSIYENQKNNMWLFTIPFYSILFLLKRKYAKGPNFRKNWKPLSAIVSVGISIPFFLWNYVLLNKMNQDISEDKELKKYLSLDVDKEKIKLDLLNYNIVLQ